MNRFYLLGFCIAFFAFGVQGQPTITSFSPTSGPIGTSVTIIGTNFDTTPANNVVFFGATQATVSTATATELMVTVPLGATYQPITILANGLQVYSAAPFVVTFDGAGINVSSFSEVDFSDVEGATGNLHKQNFISDLDGDGKVDLVVGFGTNLNIYRNTSTDNGSISFASRVDLPNAGNVVFFSIGDLDGDSKPDIATTDGSTLLSVYRNTSTGAGTISFATKIDITVGIGSQSVAIGDLDGDGKVDLAVANAGSVGSDELVSVFRNTSTGPGVISFADQIDFTSGDNPEVVMIGDLDGDYKSDLAVSNTGGHSVSIFRNTSSGIGSISFAAKVDFATGTRPESLAMGDMDGDGKADFAVPNNTSATVSIFRNTSTEVGTISFASEADLLTGLQPRSISMGDLDGNGAIDLIVTSGLGSDFISMFRNTNLGVGTIGFADKVDYAAADSPQDISIGDLDGDGRSDFVVTNNDDTKRISIFRNAVDGNFITTWQTTSASESITIPTTETGYNYEVSWGDGTFETLFTGDATHTYEIAGTYTVAISGNFPRIYFHEGLEGQDATKIKSIEQWGSIAWSSLKEAFQGCSTLSINATDAPDLTNVTDMTAAFRLSGINQSIDHWDVSNVQDFANMFGSSSYNQPLNSWSLTSATSLSAMFQQSVFDQPLDQWDVSNVEYMTDMFGYSNFNQDISNWVVSGARIMSAMFINNTSFNQPIGAWDVSNVETFGGTNASWSGMFKNASSFDQDLSNWDIANATDMPEMFDNSGMSTANYDNTLIGWSTLDNGETQIPTDITLGATGLAYCVSESERNTLINTYDWTITGDSKDCSDLVAYYPFNGNANDESGNANNGTVTGATLTLDRFGIANKAYSFNKDIPHYITIPDADELDFATSDFTLQGWIRSSSSIDFHRIISKGSSSGSDGYMLRTTEGGKVLFELNGNVLATTNATIQDGNWHLISAVLDRDMTASLYVDGSLDVETTINTASIDPTNTTPLTIGIHGTDSEPFDGSIDDIRIYNRALSASEIADLYTEGNWPLASSSFITTWQTTDVSESITIPTVSGETYNYAVDWGDGTDETGFTGDATHTYATAGTYTVAISGGFPRVYFNNAGDKDKILTIEQWGDNQWTSMESAFYGCPNLTYNATDVPNLTSVVTMENMFNGCSSITGNLSNWDVSTIQNFKDVFISTNFNSDISGWNTTSATNMQGMFAHNPSFNQPIGNWDVSNVMYMHAMFQGATSFIQDLSGWDVSSVTDMSNLFNGASAFNQDLSGWDISSVTTMESTLNSVGMSTANYDNTLIGWSTLDNGETKIPTDITLGADGLTYCEGTSARNTLKNEFSWTITGDQSGCLGLVAYYPFNGNINDESGNGNNGIASGSLVSVTDLNNIADRAYTFDGIDDKISLPFSSQSLGNEMTISAWVYRTKTVGVDVEMGIVSNDVNLSSRGVSMAVVGSGSNTIAAKMTNGLGSLFSVSGNAVPESTWTYYTITYDGSNLRLYENGVLTDTQAASGDIGGTNNFEIGHDTYDLDGSRYFGGKLDDIRIYNTALTDQEILDFYNTEKPVVLVASYSFTGNANDESGNSNHPSLGDGSSTSSQPTLTQDQFGNSSAAYSFDGTGQYMEVPNDASLNLSDEMTLTAWVKLVENGSLDQSIISKGENGNIDYLLNIKDGKIEIGSQSFDYLIGNQNILDESWHHIAGTYDGINLKTYVDGQLDASGSFSGDILQSTGPLFLGAHETSGPTISRFANGSIDNIHIYSSALSPSRITDLYNSESGLVAYYPFNGNANDESGNGNDGTVNGNVTLTIDRFENSANAYTFSGALSDNISGSDAGFPLGSEHRTLTGWVRTSDATNQGHILEYGSTTSDNQKFGIGLIENQAHFWSHNEDIKGTTNLIDGNWHFIAATFDGTDVIVYVDAVVEGSSTIPLNTVSTGIFKIGSSELGNHNGDIDDIRLYSRALSGSEIQDLFNEGGWPNVSSETDILTFSLLGQTAMISPDPSNHTVDIEVAHGTDIAEIIASFTLSSGASVKIGDAVQNSGETANDFSSNVTYTITAEDGITIENWTITVTIASNTETDILSFLLTGQTDIFTPDSKNHAVNIDVGSTTDVTNLIATFTLSEGASATINGNDQTSEFTPNDFSSDVIYLVTAEDGSTAQEWTVTVTVVEDSEGPVIVTVNAPTPYQLGSAGTAISATVTDNVAVSSVKLFHKKISALGFTESNMELSNESYSAALIDRDFGSLGLEFYIEAEDAVGNTTSTSETPQFIYSSFAEENSQSITGLSSGKLVGNYNIIAIPYRSASVSTIFTDLSGSQDKSIWRLFQYNGTSKSNQELFPSSTLVPGKGYWYINSSSSSINIGEVSATQANRESLFEIDLKDGWNMIGNPYPFTIDWNDVISHNNNSNVGTSLTKYNAGYNGDFKTLAKFEGAFVTSNGDTTIEIPIPDNPTGGRVRTNRKAEKLQNLIGSDQWAFRLDVSNKQHQYKVSGIGMDRMANDGVDGYDMGMLPRWDEYLDISFDENLTRSIVPVEDSYVWKFQVNSTYKDETNTITWDKTRISDSEYGMLLLDIEAQRVVNMSDEDSYIFEAPDENKQFELFYALKSELYGMLNPESNFLGNPYPNPTSKELTIPLTTSNQQTVAQIQIIDLFGKVVHRYESGSFSQGYHEIEINELSLRSGTYIMRVEFHGGDKIEVFNKKLFLKK